MKITVPSEVYLEAGLAAYDEKQLITELHRRQVSEHTILNAFYALDAMADHRMETAMEVRDELYSQDV